MDTPLKYFSKLYRQAWKDTKSFFGWNFQTVLAVVLIAASWAVLWNWQGQQAVQNEFFNKLSYLVPLLAAAVVVFIFNLLVVSPYRLTNALHLERRATIEENEALKERLKPTLIVELREGDNRYLVKRDEYEGTQLIGISYSGQFSVTNPPSNLQSQQGVAVIVKDILGCGTDFRDVKLRFNDQFGAPPIAINPGETKFVEFVYYFDAPGQNDIFRIIHTGIAGSSRVSTPIQKAERYVAKIHVTGTNMSLISKLITFGIKCEKFYLSMSD